MNLALAAARRVRMTANRSLRMLTDTCGAALYMWELVWLVAVTGAAIQRYTRLGTLAR
jgi:hypothetical protein